MEPLINDEFVTQKILFAEKMNFVVTIAAIAFIVTIFASYRSGVKGIFTAHLIIAFITSCLWIFYLLRPGVYDGGLQVFGGLMIALIVNLYILPLALVVAFWSYYRKRRKEINGDTVTEIQNH